MTKKSVLQQARAAYQPKLPTALWGAVKAVEGAATESVADQEQIKNYSLTLTDCLNCVLKKTQMWQKLRVPTRK